MADKGTDIKNSTEFMGKWSGGREEYDGYRKVLEEGVSEEK